MNPSVGDLLCEILLLEVGRGAMLGRERTFGEEKVVVVIPVGDIDLFPGL